MKTLIQVVLVAVVVGGVSGGASFYLKPKPVEVAPAADGAKAEVAKTDADQESPDLDHDSGHGEESKSLVESHGETAHSSPTEAELSAAIKADHDLPVAVRPVTFRTVTKPDCSSPRSVCARKQRKSRSVPSPIDRRG